MQISIEKYLSDLASSAPAPGGGAAAALSGAQAAALLAMVARLSIAKAEDPPDTSWQKMADQLDLHRSKLMQLAEDDEAAFSRVMQTYKLPKNNDSEKAVRTEAIQSALKGATKVPLAVMNESASLATYYPPLAKTSNVQVVSDTAIAVILADAAIDTALYNVKINLKYLKDMAFKTAVEATVTRCMNEKSKLRSEALKWVDQRLSP